MLSLPSSVRVFVCLAAVDMRRSFDGLSCLAEQVVQADPLSGHLFVFRGRRGDRIKILYWDRDGYALWYKRLEAGTFRFPCTEGPSREISLADLGLLLEGIDLASVTRRKRFSLAVAGTAGTA
jgi:transposase